MKRTLLLSLCLWTGCCFGSELVEQMSLEEKVGQVLMVHFQGETANDDAATLIQQTKVGGIIYYNWSNGLHSPQQISTLSSALQKLTKANRFPIPLLIATDQEGGVVARLQSGFTSFPGNRALGATEDPHLAKLAAFSMGEELLSVGINMNLAPVVDINSNPRNPVIGVRSFGEDQDTVITFGKAFLEGCKQAAIISTLKHFPGYGDVAIDPHEDLPIIRKSLKELESLELLPFAKLSSSADAIMTAHILVPDIDAKNCATLSKKTLNYLRETIGFQGVIVADSLVMDGVLKTCHSVDEASIQALNAGCDLLILGGKLLSGEHTGFELTTSDVQRVQGAIIEAVKNGRITEERLNTAVSRILSLKNRYFRPLEELVSTKKKEITTTSEHSALAKKIATLALRTMESQPNTISALKEKKVLIVASDFIQKTLQDTSLITLGKSTTVCLFKGLNPSQDEISTILQKADSADLLILCSYNAWKNPSAVSMTKSLIEKKKELILLCVRDPLDATLFPSIPLIFTSFSPSVPSIQAIYDTLANK